MAVDIVMPQMGESMCEGTITKWLKKPGDKVERDEPLFEISTDKVDAEIPSPAAGVLKEIKVNEGQTVPIQTVVAVIEADGAGAATAAPAPASAKAEAPKPTPVPASPKDEAPAPKAAPPAPAPPPAQRPGPSLVPAAGSPAPPQRPAATAASGEKIRSSPLVRRIARDQNIDLAQVPGTGAGGRISKRDILAAVEGGGPFSGTAAGTAAGAAPAPSRPSVPPPASGGAAASAVLENAVPREKMYFGHYEVQPMSVMRQRIAEHMVASKRVSAHVYSVDEIDMTRVAALRAKAKEEFEKRYETKLTFMPFFVKAAVAGLRAYPTLNASLDGTSMVLHKEINIGIAVALDWGLLVPVIRNADEKNLLGIQRNLNDL